MKAEVKVSGSTSGEWGGGVNLFLFYLPLFQIVPIQSLAAVEGICGMRVACGILRAMKTIKDVAEGQTHLLFMEHSCGMATRRQGEGMEPAVTGSSSSDTVTRRIRTTRV